MSVLRPHIAAMNAYVPGEQPPPGTCLIKLNTNENPYAPSPAALHAIQAELEAGDAEGALLRLYSDPAATPFRAAAAQLAGLPLDHVICGNGSDELLALLFRAVVGEGDPVAYPYPTYTLYDTLAQAHAARRISYDFDRDFRLPRALFSCRAKLVLIASPNSPSGTFFSPNELGELADSLPGGLLLVDEAYVAFGDGRSALPLVAQKPNVAVLRTLSKSHSLAGLRLGYLCAPPPIIEGLWKVKDSYNLDRLAIVAGAAALADSAWTEANLRKVRQTRAWLAERLRALGLEPLPSAANFLFVRFASAERARAAFHFLREHAILVRYFPQRLIDDGLRISVGTDQQAKALVEALEALLRPSPAGHA